MDVITIQREYIRQMIQKVQGLKVMLLDKDTTGIISMVYSLTQILEQEVFLVERLDNEKRDEMQHMKCIVFIRPSEANLARLHAELQSPRYGEYHIFFANILQRNLLEGLASADEHQLVAQVQEYYSDYSSINRDLFTLNIASVLPLFPPRWDQRLFTRMADGLVSVLLSLKKRPHIRYQEGSELTKKLAQEVSLRIDGEPALFDFRRSESTPILLVLDRRADPITPLLTQWTYQAMLHELIGIKNNRLNLKERANVHKDLQEVVISADQDDFFRANMYENFGDLCSNLKDLMDKFQEKTKSSQSLQTIEDMKNFVENYSEFRSSSTQTSKHVTLVAEISKAVESRNLLEISQLEQELACSDNHTENYEKLQQLLTDPNIENYDAIRMSLLYALRYESDGRNQIPNVKAMLLRKGVDEVDVEKMDTICQFSRAQTRQAETFGGKSLSRFMKSVARSVKGVSNVYTQHTPLLSTIVDNLAKQKLSQTQYPFVLGGPTKERVQDVIVFIVGGATYEEAVAAHTLNAANTGLRVVLGSTSMLNSEMFLEDLHEYQEAYGDAGPSRGRDIL